MQAEEVVLVDGFETVSRKSKAKPKEKKSVNCVLLYERMKYGKVDEGQGDRG